MSTLLRTARLVPAEPRGAAAEHAAGLLRLLGAADAGQRLKVGDASDSGPVADWAASGAMELTGYRDGPPLVAPGRPASAARGALLALDALVGRPLGVAGHLLLGERAALTGFRRSAPRSAGGSCRAVPTDDGWVAFSLARDADLALLAALVEREVSGDCWETDPWDVVQAWTGSRSNAEVVERAQLLGLVAAPVPPASEPTSQPPVWPPWRLSSWGRRRPTGARRHPPLVLDLSALWAGPLCGHLLGLAGARVVRLESTTRPDGGRLGCPAFDDLLHAGQPSVALPFGTSEGRARLHELVARADVVVTSARPRALDQLGLDPIGHLNARTDGVWVQITAHEPQPDGAVWAGYGDDCAMAAGLVRRAADGRPLPCGDALADPLTGVHAAVAAQAALQAGGRHLLELSLSRVAASVMGALAPVDAHPVAGGWGVAGEHGVVRVAAPTARRPAGRARPLGADTAAVLREG